MHKTLFLFFSLCLLHLGIYGQEPLLGNAYNRSSTSLNGVWNYIVDPYENGYYNYRYTAFDQEEHTSVNAYFTNSKPKDKTALIEYDFDAADTLKVPGDWNTQKEKLYYYEGSVWYRRVFDYAKKENDNKVFVYFGAANYQADVYLNGKKLGRHIGGFTPFNFEVTSILKDNDNFLVVKVDNKRKVEGVPTLNTDWWNYGGLTRDVKLIETPATFIQDYFLQLNPKNNKEIKGYVQLSGAEANNAKVTLSIPELKLKKQLVTDSTGRAEVLLNSKKINYWSPQNPKRYTVSLAMSEDVVTDLIGFRSISTKGTAILLNDTPIFLKGICIHEESPISKGRANTLEDAQQLLNWVKELGGNYVRLAHYPHNEHMVRLADKMGILVWEENPVYWTIDWENEATYQNAKNQLSEVITRDKNRASVIIWSMANETPNSVPRNTFLQRLAAHCRNMDDTRLLSAALEQTTYQNNPLVKTIADPFAETVDVLSFNQYIGWYDGLPDKTALIEWKITQNKPVLISEFGAGAKFGLHGDSLTRWSEEYQADLYKKTLKMISKIDQLQGFTPWILIDFRSPRRPLKNIQDDYNRKGLLSEKGEKKQAFFVLQDYYQNLKGPD